MNDQRLNPREQNTMGVFHCNPIQSVNLSSSWINYAERNYENYYLTQVFIYKAAPQFSRMFLIISSSVNLILTLLENLIPTPHFQLK